MSKELQEITKSGKCLLKDAKRFVEIIKHENLINDGEFVILDIRDISLLKYDVQSEIKKKE